jgi:hypothetical protein
VPPFQVILVLSSLFSRFIPLHAECVLRMFLQCKAK